MKIRHHLFRHVESVMNTEPHLVGGRSNRTPPSEKGKIQGARLGEFIAKQKIIPKLVVSSPAVRTLYTAMSSLEASDLHEHDIYILDNLQEMSQGDWVGQNRADIYVPSVLEQLNMDFKAPGGESMNEVGERMLRATDEIEAMIIEADLSSEVVDVFVYTHGFAIKCLLARQFGWSHQQTYKTEIPNASRTVLEREGDFWQLTHLAQNTQ